MDFGFLYNQYPPKDYTSGDKLLMSLGSFWTQVFQEQGTLRGYTLGMAEELIQSYYVLMETLNSYSVKDVPVLSRTRWQPIIIKRSTFNQTPFKFKANAAVFGSQPENDHFYRAETFKFGRPESPNSSVYSFSPTFPLRKFSIIADRVIEPTFVATNGIDVIIDESNNLYFNCDIFDKSNIPRATIVEDNGVPAKYTLADGTTGNDELMILWCYNAENDADYIYDNFGKLFDLKLPSSEVYKGMLSAIFNLFVAGPTVNAVKSIMAAFNGITPVVAAEETIEDIYSDSLHKYVVTDQRVYKFETYQQVLADLSPGSVVYGGDILVDTVEYYDTLVKAGWWKKVLPLPKLGVSSHVFLGNYKHQLFFSTSPELATLSADDNVVFPMEGEAADVAEFQKYINLPANKSTVKRALGLKNPGNVAVITPIDFLFYNFFKNNTALLKFNFYSPEELAVFFSYFPRIKSYLPPHVYILLYVNLSMPPLEYSRMNSRFSLPQFSNAKLSLDGSDNSGMRPELLPEDPEYYKNYKDRLFCVSESPQAMDGDPLFYPDNLERVTLANSERMAGVTRAIDGKVFTAIPNTVPAPTNKEIPTVLLIDFS